MEAIQTLTCLSEAGREFGVSHKVISELVRIHRIKTSPHPNIAHAKGIDANGMKKLRKLLSPPAEQDRHAAKTVRV